MRRRCLAIGVAFALGLSTGGCGERDDDGTIDIEDDTLELAVPQDLEERIERGARQVGGAVGEAIEETGAAIEEAGERIQEEVQNGEPADTNGME
ncbi:MAG TPA: hypothetical protein VM737_07810 [Gemmatimonadota bacterium]|nr:hypothetical protein [Gemmatimonadota bacterium]